MTENDTFRQAGRPPRFLVVTTTVVLMIVVGVLAWLYVSVMPDSGAGEPARAFYKPDHAELTGFFGYVDVNGKWAIHPTCIHASDYSEGLALAENSPFAHGRAYVDAQGRPAFSKVSMKDGGVIPGERWLAATDFHDGLAAVTRPHQTIFVNKTGHEVFHLEHDYLGAMDWSAIGSATLAFSEGLLTLDKNGKPGVIDRTGAWVIDPATSPPFHWIGSFVHGMAVAGKSDGEISHAGVINPKGETVLPFDYNSIESLGDHSFLVQKDGLLGIVDVHNQWILQPSSRMLESIEGERCKVWCQEEGTVLDGDGKLLFKTALKLEGKFSEGLCAVSDPKGKEPQGFIDESGQVVFRLAPGMSTQESFHHGLLLAGKTLDNGDAYSALLNKQGKIVIEDASLP